MSSVRPAAMSRCVRARVPRHSFSAMPHSVLKMMMLAMCSVQLEKPYRPICVSPMP